MNLTHNKPTAPGWYWCRNHGDEPGETAQFVCRVDRREDGLWCSWMTQPGAAEVMHESQWDPRARWAGPLEGPIDREWVVVSTALRQGFLLLCCNLTNARGFVPNPSKKEWGEAFGAPSRPYPWPVSEYGRVILWEARG